MGNEIGNEVRRRVDRWRIRVMMASSCHRLLLLLYNQRYCSGGEEVVKLMSLINPLI
jgi:hypothetical protein